MTKQGHCCTSCCTDNSHNHEKEILIKDEDGE